MTEKPPRQENINSKNNEDKIKEIYNQRDRDLRQKKLNMKIAYVGNFSFPSSNANSLRIKGISEALVMAGHEVEIYSSDKTAPTQIPPPLGKRIKIHCTNEYESGIFSSLRSGIRGLFLGDVTLGHLKRLQSKPDVVILYGTHLGYLLRLLCFCRKNKIPLILDIVEWYDPRHLPGGFFGPFALANELSMRVFAQKSDGMFVISRYLENYYSKKHCKTLRVPPLFSFSLKRPAQLSESNQKINLCYSGSPGKKEDLESIFMGLQLAYESGARFCMHIIGLTKDEFEAAFGMQNLSVTADINAVRFYGRLENSEARQIVASCDFLVLLRKNQRFTKAGFPSKVSESLCLGTPIIGNLSSNLDEFLVDNKNSIIVKKTTPKEFCDAILRAAQTRTESDRQLKDNALETANKNFRPEQYSKKISSMLESCLIQKHKNKKAPPSKDQQQNPGAR